ncbi:hypothetical protein [Nocardia araoensis]|uniref:hypothetical protein n=1 Tax=Nocardia araoensis TaxID=228600 RepID=UPI0005851180|nr:hypothetical protein [Nocardia araoensis]
MTKTPNKALARLAATAVALTAALVGAAGAVTPAIAAPLVAPLHAQAPGAGELTAKLRVAINTGAARGTRAAELESGDAGVATMDKIAGLLAVSPPSLRYTVINPSTSGDRIDAQLLITTEGYPDFTYDVSWKQIDGYWKLTRQAECSLASALALSC